MLLAPVVLVPLTGVVCFEDAGSGSLEPAGLALMEPVVLLETEPLFWKRLLDTWARPLSLSTEFRRWEVEGFNPEGVMFSCNLSCQKLRGEADFVGGVL